MADIAARREARRRRILENSQSRLRRISSVQHGNVEVEDSILNLNLVNELLTLNNYNPLVETKNIIDEEKNEEIDVLYKNPGVEQIENVTTRNTVSNKKTLIIFIIAIFTKILSILCTNLMHIHMLNLQCSHANQIFTPFLIYEIIDLFVIKNSVKDNVFLYTLFLLTNVPAKYIEGVIRFISILGVVMQDMFLYSFIFIITEICFSIISLDV